MVSSIHIFQPIICIHFSFPCTPLSIVLDEWPTRNKELCYVIYICKSILRTASSLFDPDIRLSTLFSDLGHFLE